MYPSAWGGVRLMVRQHATNPAPQALRDSLSQFIRYRREYLSGDEKGEAQVFCDRLFLAFGHAGVREAGATLEMRIKRNDAKGTAFADLMWKPRCLIEMKKAGADLSRHYRQAFEYWIHAVPERPRYVVLCNFDEFWVYDFDVQLDEPMDRVKLDDLVQRVDALAFLLPQEEKPVFGNDLVAVTRDAAATVARVFRALHERGIERKQAQRFVLQAVVAMFSEDVGLLPAKYFTRALEDASTGVQAFDLLFGLFREMNTPGATKGGRYRGTPYFNGGIFDAVEPFELTSEELGALRWASVTDWAAVRPEIFGTLFEGSMAAGERHAQGAHFTSQADIAKVVIPTIVTPWRQRLQAAGSIAELERVLGHMYAFRVLDPACGSGNFLYVAYREMRRLEHETLDLIAERRRTGFADQGALAYVTPNHFHGIDINPFAVEVAKVTMMLAKKLAADELGDEQQVLPLDNLDDTIVAADALFTAWPRADVVIGNPPYLGRRKMLQELPPAYTQSLAAAFPSVGGVSDFVCYWFPRAHDHLASGGRAGLVATNTVRQNESREASLDYVVDNGGVIFDAVSSQPWSGDAAVNVSIVNWSKQVDVNPKVLWLNEGQLRLEVAHIPSSLSPAVDVRAALALRANQTPQVCFQGQTPGVTRGFVLNAAGRAAIIEKGPHEARFIHPLLGGNELLKRVTLDEWIIDLPFADLLEADGAAPLIMKHLRQEVLPVRQKAAAAEEKRATEMLAANNKARPNKHHAAFLAHWWRLSYRRTEMLSALAGIDRYIALTILANEKRASIYTFVDSSIRPAASAQVFTFDDDYSFGVLSSSLHRKWFEARCSTLETRLRYTPTTVWDSFPWPQAPTTAAVAAIVETVAALLELRSEQLDMGISLSRQYDSLRSPGRSRLRDLHNELDTAVSDAYGFSQADELLSQLLALNHDLAAAGEPGRRPGGDGLVDVHRSTYRLPPPPAKPGLTIVT